MSTNISKQKRDDLVNKIKAIRTYIASGYQNENTGNLLTYLSELEKEVKAKKYGGPTSIRIIPTTSRVITGASPSTGTPPPCGLS